MSANLRTKYAARSRGMTLLEVLATVGVMAALLPAISEAISLSTRVAANAKGKAHATTLVEGKLADLVGTKTYLGGESSGDFGDTAPGFNWNWELVGTSEQGIEELRVTVWWMEADLRRDVALSTLVYDSTAVTSATSQPAGGTP